MKVKRLTIRQMWEYAGYDAGHAAMERRFDGCPEADNHRQYCRDRRREFLRYLWREVVGLTWCRAFGHDHEIDEAGDAESGPIIYWECRRCNHGERSFWNS